MVDARSNRAILGISAYYHDAAAALVVDGAIIAAAQEERFTRKKNDASFPAHAIRYCLEEGGVTLDELSAVVFYDKPLLKFERLLETCLLFAPSGLRQFLSSMTVWVQEKLFLKRSIVRELKKIGIYDLKNVPLLFSEHHLSHAASAFYPSPFKEAAVVTIDGVGEWATASICHGKDSDIKLLEELRFPHSVGLLYSAFTYFLGFEVNNGEYKLMGLAPYGDHGEKTAEFKERIKELVRANPDGSVFLDQNFFNYASGLTMINEARWEELFGFSRRNPKDELEVHHCDLALAIQEVTEDIMLNMARHAKEITGAKYLCLAGGVALNCVGNGKIVRAKIFDDVWVQPAAGDAGGALGAALAAYHLYFKAPRKLKTPDGMHGSYLGPAYSDGYIEDVLRTTRARWHRAQDEAGLCKEVAGYLADGKVVGWFQGRMEWGPRALGSRSILADPRSPGIQKSLNLMTKFREGFRPFAPSVRAEDMKEYFELDRPSPYMLFVAPIVRSRRTKEPNDYASRDWRGKLYHPRSDIPAVTHIDYSARIQSVSKDTASRYHTLLSEFKAKTGYGLLVNTSFNVKDEPIVCTPEDAYRCFMATHIDYLVMGNYILKKNDQSTAK